MFKNLFKRNHKKQHIKNELRYIMIISGKVQCVGFRFFAFSTARTLYLTGWVRNCDDNTVKLEVQGNEKAIKKFVDHLKKGNGISKVKNIYIEKTNPVSKEFDFKILN